jgi:uncharacterized protein YbjT (DUF2867 family)
LGGDAWTHELRPCAVDIRGSVAAKALQTRDWHGVVVRELLGPRDLTYAEATRIVGKRIKKPDLCGGKFSVNPLA